MVLYTGNKEGLPEEVIIKLNLKDEMQPLSQGPVEPAELTSALGSSGGLGPPPVPTRLASSSISQAHTLVFREGK